MSRKDLRAENAQLRKTVEQMGKQLQARQPPDLVFGMWKGGMTNWDQNLLMACEENPDTGQAFFATALLQVMHLMQLGQLKGVDPTKLRVTV